jgi:hypothetical protein
MHLSLVTFSVGGKPKERSRCGQRCVAVNATLTGKYQNRSFRATVISFRDGFIAVSKAPQRCLSLMAAEFVSFHCGILREIEAGPGHALT